MSPIVIKRRMFARRILALSFLWIAVAPLLRAQLDLTPTEQKALPTGHLQVIDLESGPNDEVLLFTLDVVLGQSPSYGTWTSVGSLRNLVRPLYNSRVATLPSQSNLWAVTSYDNDDNPGVWHVTRAAPGFFAYRALPHTEQELPYDLAMTANGSLYIIDGSHRLWFNDTANNAPDFIRLTDAVSDINRLRVGGDGLLYALNSSNEVYRFSAEGNAIDHYTLAGAAFSEFTVSSAGVLFAFGLSSDYGGIYDAADGDYLGRFYYDSSDVSIDSGAPGITLGTDTTTGVEQLHLVTGSGDYLWSYDVTGITAIPEPSTYAAFAGLGACLAAAFKRRRALGFVIARRRRAASTANTA